MFIPNPKKQGALVIGSMFELEISRKMGSQMWRAFMEGRLSTHSARASTLPYLIRRCERVGEPYVLTGVPGYGYSLIRGNPSPEPASVETSSK